MIPTQTEWAFLVDDLAEIFDETPNMIKRCADMAVTLAGVSKDETEGK